MIQNYLEMLLKLTFSSFPLNNVVKTPYNWGKTPLSYQFAGRNGTSNFKSSYLKNLFSDMRLISPWMVTNAKSVLWDVRFCEKFSHAYLDIHLVENCLPSKSSFNGRNKRIRSCEVWRIIGPDDTCSTIKNVLQTIFHNWMYYIGGTPSWQNLFSRCTWQFVKKYLQCYHIFLHNIPYKFHRCRTFC